MRVIYAITRGDHIGGAQMHVRDLAIETARAGHDVLVVSGNNGDLTTQLRDAGVAVEQCAGMARSIHPIKDISATRNMMAIIRAWKPEIVSAHSSKAGVVCRIAANRTGVPCIFTAHGFAFTDGVPQPTRTIYKGIERAMARISARIICVSEFDRQIGISAGITPERLTTVHNGIKDVSPDLRAHPGSDGPMRIVMTARFDRQKDQETLLRALTLVPEVEADLIGVGPSLDPMQQLATEFGLSDRVRFLGHRNDVPELLSRAHVFVLSSHWEGFPLSTLEAMRAGLPVIVSDVGGAAEAVIDGTTGFVVPPRDREALAERIRELAANPEMRSAMGDHSRTRYEAEYTFPAMLDRTLSLQQEIIDRTDRSAN